MRSAHVGLWFCLGLLAGCSGKKEIPPLPDPVEFEGKVSGTEGKQLVLTFKALDEDIAKRATRIPSAVIEKNGAFKGKAVPGRYEVTALPVALGTQGGGPQGPGANSTPGAIKPTLLGKVEIP